MSTDTKMTPAELQAALEQFSERELTATGCGASALPRA